MLVIRRLALVLAALASGCDGDPPDPDAGGIDAGVDAGPGEGRPPCDPDAGPPPPQAAGFTDECTEALVLAGFGLRFAEAPQPLGRFAVSPRLGDDLTACDDSAGFRTAALRAELVGGPDPAEGHASVTYTTVGAGMDRRAPDGGAPFPEVRVRRELLSLRMIEPEITVTRQFDLVSAGLADTPEVTVVLDGIELDTDLPQGIEFPTSINPAEGYALGRLGAVIGDVRRVGDEIEFDVTARYTPGRTGVTAEDRAAELAVVDLVVRYAVIASPLPPVSATVSYREQHRPHGEAPASVCRLDPSAGRVTLSGPAGAHAMVALRGFDLRLFPDDPGEGVRVRELSVHVSEHDYTPATGEGVARVEGYLSNEGPAPPRRPIDFAFEAEVVQIAWDGPSEARRLRVDGPLTDGRADLSLPLVR